MILVRNLHTDEDLLDVREMNRNLEDLSWVIRGQHELHWRREGLTSVASNVATRDAVVSESRAPADPGGSPLAYRSQWTPVANWRLAKVSRGGVLVINASGLFVGNAEATNTQDTGIALALQVNGVIRTDSMVGSADNNDLLNAGSAYSTTPWGTSAGRTDATGPGIRQKVFPFLLCAHARVPAGPFQVDLMYRAIASPDVVEKSPGVIRTGQLFALEMWA